MRIRMWVFGLVCALAGPRLLRAGPVLAVALPRGGERPSLTETVLFSHMNQAARRVHTVSAQLAYTTVTVLVNDRSTQNGVLYYHKGRRRPEVMIRFSGPAAKDILFKKGTAEIYYPNLKQIQEYNLEHRQNLLQQFLLLGFGTETGQIESSYTIHYAGERKVGTQMAALLELKPMSKDVAAQLKKIDLWVSEQNWMPIQQQFFETSGDYLIARYSGLKVNPPVSPSTFKINAPGAERVKMN